jgi:hypothetical protein
LSQSDDCRTNGALLLLEQHNDSCGETTVDGIIWKNCIHVFTYAVAAVSSTENREGYQWTHCCRDRESLYTQTSYVSKLLKPNKHKVTIWRYLPRLLRSFNASGRVPSSWTSNKYSGKRNQIVIHTPWQRASLTWFLRRRRSTAISSREWTEVRIHHGATFHVHFDLPSLVKLPIEAGIGPLRRLSSK